MMPGRKESFSKETVIPSDIAQVQVVTGKLQSCLKKKGIDENSLFYIKLAVEEALVNAIKHGNRLNKKLPVHVEFKADREKITISVRDQGKGFDYKSIPNPTRSENLSKVRGRGVFLIKQIMDEVRFNKEGNRITMVKYLKAPNK